MDTSTNYMKTTYNYLDALGSSRNRRRVIGVKGEDEEDGEGEEREGHDEERNNEPGPLPKGQVQIGIRKLV